MRSTIDLSLNPTPFIMFVLLEASVSALQAQGTVAMSSYFDICSSTSKVSMSFTFVVDVVERCQRNGRL